MPTASLNPSAGKWIPKAAWILLFLCSFACSARVEAAAAGELKGMGSSRWGQLGIGLSFATPAPITSVTDVSQATAGYYHTLFLKTDGSLWTVGYNGHGQLGDGSLIERTSAVQVATDVAQISAGYRHSVFIKTDGSLWAMGGNDSGQLGDGSLTERLTPVLIDTDVVQVCAGGDQTLFIKTDGSLWATGNNGFLSLDNNTQVSRRSPALIATDVARACAGATHALFIKTDGSLWGMGGNGSGQLGDNPAPRHTPYQIASDVAQVTAGEAHTIFVKTDGSLWAMGENERGQLGDGTRSSRSTPVKVADDVAHAVAGYEFTLFIKTDASLWATGQNNSGQLGDDSTVLSRDTPVQVAANVTSATAGVGHTLFIKSDGSLWGMGSDNNHQLGDQEILDRVTPVTITSDVIGVAAGSYSSLFIKADGSLWGAGSNGYGQLGDGTLKRRSLPIQITTDVRHVVSGGDHSAFIKTDGSLWTMGNNTVGQLGDGGAAARSTPIQIATGVLKVSASNGGAHTLFIKTDGTLWGMGHNSAGQLGDGTRTNRRTPIQIATGVTHVSAGATFSLFIKTDDSLWAMGGNDSGQLGDGSLNERLIPVKIATGVAQVAAGGEHSAFVKTNGSLWTTGYNYFGQLGDDSFISRKTPVQIATNVSQVAACWYDTLFIKTDGSLWITGRDENGELGNGLPKQSRPKPVKIASDALTIAGGAYHALFLTGTFHTVTFELGAFGTRSGGGALVQRVVASPLAPAVSALPGYVFHGWDTEFDTVDADLTIHAIYRRAQTITFPAPAKRAFATSDADTLVLSPTTNSTLPVILTVIDGPATLGADGRTLTITDSGTITLRATQPGDDTWAAATPVERQLIITGKPQKITFAAPAVRTYGDAPFELQANASSGLPVTFEIVSGPASLEDGILTITDVGRIMIKASQTGGDGFNPAPSLTRTLVINKAPLIVRAQNVTRLVGQADPTFELVYSGFVGPDADDPHAAVANLDRAPSARARTSLKSRPGDYPIQISGGSDDRYVFIPANPPGMLTILGFSGAHEALLVSNHSSTAIPVGKLSLTITPGSLAYTGTLTLADTAKPIVVSSASKTGYTTRFTDDGGETAAASWSAESGDSLYSLELFVDLHGSLTGSLSINDQFFAAIEYGRRIHVRPTSAQIPWAGRYTLTLPPGSGLFEFSGPAPQGYGHATARISTSSGLLAIAGKLADGAPLTASLKPGSDASYLLFQKTYSKRPASFVGGKLRAGYSYNSLVWKRTELVAPADDKLNPDSFGHLLLSASLDHWLPPVSKGKDAATLPQRLGLAETPSGAGVFELHHLSDFADLSALPVASHLSASGKLSVATPNTAAWKLLSLNPSTGAFTGSFIQTEQHEPAPAKPTSRTIKFSGVFRQSSDEADAIIGSGFFLLPAPPEIQMNGPVPGMIIFTRMIE